MPGATVHFRMVFEMAGAEGMPPTDAEAVATACINVDQLWPGSTKPWRHFNPTASLYWAPRYFREALAARGILHRDPDDWAKMTPGARAAIERETRSMLRTFMAS